MFNYIGLLFLFFLVVLLFAFFSISILLDIRKSKNAFYREKQKIQIINDLLNLRKRLDSPSMASYKEDPLLVQYFAQVDSIIRKDPYKIEDLNICYIKKSSHRNSDPTNNIKEKIFESYINASREVKSELTNLSKIFESIYAFNHPYRYRWICFKKKLELRILKILIKICIKILDMLEKVETTSKSEKHSEKVASIKANSEKARETCPRFLNEDCLVLSN